MAVPPIDPATLQVCLAPPGSCRTLPAEAFASAAVFDWEQSHFFEGSWVCTGRADELSDPGSQKAVRVGREGVLLVRDTAGGLRGFYNVCRHRGHELLESGTCSRRSAIKCPYHAWVYGLDGTLRGAPHFGDVSGFDRDDYSLVAVRVEEWHGWVFVNVSGDATDFADHCGGLDRLIAAHECARLKSVVHHDYVVNANWKIITENYHECYHCSNIHPELCKVTPPDSGLDDVPDGAWTGGSMDLRDHATTMSLTGESGGVVLRGLDARQRRQVFYYSLWPNLLISLHPDYVLTHRLEPLDEGRTRVECEWLFPPEATGKEDFDPAYASEFWDITNRQDWHACEAVQRGVSSRGYRQGPLSRAEGTTRNFISMVARGYLEGRVSLPVFYATR